jgi:hypothetical protein
MTGVFHEGPHVPPEGNGGWVDPEADEEVLVSDPEEDPSEASSADEDPSEASSEDEDPMEDDPAEAAEPIVAPAVEAPEPAMAQDDDADIQHPMEEFIEEIDDDDVEDFEDFIVEGESEPDSEVDDPPIPVRSMSVPLPSHPFQRAAYGSIGAGTSAAGVAAAAATGVHPELLREVSRLSAQARATTRQMMDMGYDIQGTSARVRRMEAVVEHHVDTIASLRAELVATQTQITRLEEQVTEARLLAQQALDEGRTFRRRLAEFYQLP